MFWLKACPRCHGDLHQIKDVGVTYVSCLQCGRILTEAQEQALARASLRRPVQFARPKSLDAAA